MVKLKFGVFCRQVLFVCLFCLRASTWFVSPSSVVPVATKSNTPLKAPEVAAFEQGLVGKPCAKCSAPSFTVVDKKDVIDDLAELAELGETDVEVISTETEEGQMLKNAFGGIAAMLRFKAQG